MSSQDEFFKMVTEKIKYWAALGEDTLNGRKSADWSRHADDYATIRQSGQERPQLPVRRILEELLTGVVHSTFAVIDGEAGTEPLKLVDARSGIRVTNGPLHEALIAYLAVLTEKTS